MKILLFGKNGQVGWELQRSLAPLGHVVALGSSGEPGLVGAFTDPEGLSRTIATVKPDVVVNAAAFTAVDKAESEPEMARAINATAPGVLAEASRKIGAFLVHYSTDYVFDGSGSAPWKEDDRPRPLNTYGQTKLEGEQLITRANPRHLILRTSWVYGARGSNFAKTMLRLARERDQLSVVDDQFGAPTGAELLADVTAHALRMSMGDERLAGTYHVAASGETSWHAYARFVIGWAIQSGAEMKAGMEQVQPVPTSAFPTPARRPQNSRLDTTRFRQAFGLMLPDWEQGVTRMLQEISSNNYS